MSEEAVLIDNGASQGLVGVWHNPAGHPRAVLVMLHGWSGYRTGPHQMLTRAARRYCAQGYAVVRFDFAGRGDSEGDAALASLDTMRRDAQAVMAWCRQRTAAPLVLVGMCSGCEIAVAATGAAGTPEIHGVVLWSAPIFAALPSQDRAKRKRLDNLRQYARKLVRFSTWKKLLTGKVDRAAVGKAVAGGGGAAHRNVEADVPGQLPPGFRQAALGTWKRYQGPIFATYGTADPIADEANAWLREHCAQPPETHWVEGANHSYYGLAWEEEVISVTGSWLARTLQREYVEDLERRSSGAG